MVGGFIPQIGPLVLIVGLILVIIAVKNISEITQDKQIFNDYLLYFILNILTLVAMIALMFFAFTTIEGFTNFQRASFQDLTGFTSFWTTFGSLISACILALIIIWILMVIGALYLKRSYHRIARHTDVDLFKTVGTVYFIGALSLIFLVGFLVIFIAKIIEIIAFFSLPDNLGRQPSYLQGRRCLACGRLIPEDSIHCPYCGKSYQNLGWEKPKNY